VWNQAPQSRRDDGRRVAAVTSGAPLLAPARDDPTSYFNGTGRFIGERRPSSQMTVEGGEERVTVNLVNVPVPQAAKTILSDILAVKYTVDPKIEGKVTIQTPAPMAKSEVVDLFQSALRANGAAVINAGGAFRIVPMEQAAVGATIRLGETGDVRAIVEQSDGTLLAVKREVKVTVGGCGG